MPVQGETKIISGVTYTWDGMKWVSRAGVGPVALAPAPAPRAMTMQESAPFDPFAGGEVGPGGAVDAPPTAFSKYLKPKPTAPNTNWGPSDTTPGYWGKGKPPARPEDVAARQKGLGPAGRGMSYQFRDPWNRNPAADTGAAMAVQQELGAGVRGRTNLEKRADLAQGYDRQGAQVTQYGQRVGVQRGNEVEPILTPDEQQQADFEQKMGQREQQHGQEQQWAGQERARVRGEFSKDIDSAMEIADVQLPEGSPGWAIQNDMKQAYEERQQLIKYKKFADPVKFARQLAAIDKRIVDGAMRGKQIVEQTQAQEDLEKGVQGEGANRTTEDMRMKRQKVLDDAEDKKVAREEKRKDTMLTTVTRNVDEYYKRQETAQNRILTLTEKRAKMDADLTKAGVEDATARTSALKPFDDQITALTADAKGWGEKATAEAVRESKVRAAVIGGKSADEIIALMQAGTAPGQQTKQLTPEIVAEYKTRAGGDKAKTKQLLIADGYKVE